MGNSIPTVAAVVVSGALIGACPTTAVASQSWSAAAPANAANTDAAASGVRSAETGAMRLFLREDVMYDRRTIRMGPCYGALDAYRLKHRYYVMARFYAYDETCSDEFAFVSHHHRAVISKVTVHPGQWVGTRAWYLDSARNAAVCVSIDDFNYGCTAPY